MAFRTTLFGVLSILISLPIAAQAVRKLPSPCPVGSSCYFESDTDSNSRLLRAAYSGDLAEVRRLLNGGASVSARQKDGLVWPGYSPTCLAIEASIGRSPSSTFTTAYRDVTTLLIAHGADARGCNLAGVTEPILKIALAHGANPNQGNPVVYAMGMWVWDERNWTKVIKMLLDAGADPNVRGTLGKNMLFGIPTGPTPPNAKLPASVTGTDITELFELFIQHGIRVNDTASYIGDRECGYEVTNLEGRPTCWAWDETTRTCHVPVVYCGPERFKRFDSGTTPLMNAAAGPFDLLTRLLLSAGADPTLKNADGCTALDLAGTASIREILTKSTKSKLAAGITEIPPSTCKPSAPKFSFKLSPPVDTHVPPVEKVTLDKIDLLCYRAPVAWRTALNLMPSTAFGSKQVLSIKIYDPTKLLTAQSRAEITREVLFSIALWRRVCVQCGLTNAAVVKIGEETYVDERLLAIIQSFDFENANLGGKSLLDPSAPLNSHTLQGFNVNARTTSMVPLAEYTKTDRTNPAIEHLCSAARENVPLEFLGLRDAFKCDSQPKSTGAVLQIKVLDGPTKCGDSTAIVGCESNDLNIELNAHEYTFVRHESSEPVFGRGKAMVDLQILILHETGHWVGIYNHLTSPRNIMSAYLDECVCINQAVIDELGRSMQRTKGTAPFALLYKRP